MKMNKFATMALILLLALGNLYAEPKIRIEGGLTHDWGKVKYNGEPLKTTIKVYNDGTDTLRVYAVKPGCSCTTAPMDKKRIEPNGFSTIDVSLNIPNYPTQVDKTISINCNDNENRDVVVHLKAEVVFPLKFFPGQYFNYMNIFAEEPVTAKLVINNETDHDITIKEIVSEPADFKLNIKVNDVIKAKGSLEVEGTAIAHEIGPYFAKVNIKTDDPDVPKFEIQARGNAVGTRPVQK